MKFNFRFSKSLPHFKKKKKYSKIVSLTRNRKVFLFCLKFYFVVFCRRLTELVTKKIQIRHISVCIYNWLHTHYSIICSFSTLSNRSLNRFSKHSRCTLSWHMVYVHTNGSSSLKVFVVISSFSVYFRVTNPINFNTNIFFFTQNPMFLFFLSISLSLNEF